MTTDGQEGDEWSGRAKDREACEEEDAHRRERLACSPGTVRRLVARIARSGGGFGRPSFIQQRIDHVRLLRP
ncbi:unnamed protein product [Lampetra planeri]